MERVTVAPALTLAANTAAPVITVAHRAAALTLITVGPAILAAHHVTALTPITGAPDTTMAVDLTHITAITRVGRIRTGATAHPGDITRTHTMAVTRTLVTTTTIHTTRQRTVITHQWLHLCSVALGNSGITMAQSTESLDRRPAAPSRLLKAGMASS